MLLKPLDTDDIEVNGSDELGFFGPYYRAFRSSFAKLLCSPRFNTMDYKLAMSILDPKLNFADVEPSSIISHGIYDDILNSPISMRRLEAYVNNLADHHLISDLKLPLAHLYFQEKLPVSLSPTQASVLLCMGLQNQDASYTKNAIEELEMQQVMTLFRKVMTKFHKYLASVSSKQFAATLPQVKEVDLKPHSISVDEDLDEAAKKVKDDLKDKSDGLLNPDFLQRYAIADKDLDFESALQNGGKVPSGGVISVKSSKTKAEKYEKRKDKSDKKRSKDGSSSKSSKKKRTA